MNFTEEIPGISFTSKELGKSPKFTQIRQDIDRDGSVDLCERMGITGEYTCEFDKPKTSFLRTIFGYQGQATIKNKNGEEVAKVHIKSKGIFSRLNKYALSV